ncbi:MAG: hypothetical protein II971_01385 [Firmicutes bacterium]|nr:hypothetical protein [Bacillota bacterium]
MTEDLKKALSYIAFGALFTLANINLNFNDLSINIMPDFVGWTLFFLACGKLGSYLDGKEWLKWLAMTLIILSLALWLGGIFMPSADLSILSSIASVISAAYMFILFGSIEQLAKDNGSSRVGTIRYLKYANLAFSIMLTLLGFIILANGGTRPSFLAVLFIAIGIAALACAIVTVVTLFGLRSELTR